MGGKVEDYRAAGERKRQTRRCIGGGDGGGGGGESERSGLSDWQGFKPITPKNADLDEYSTNHVL